MREISLEEFSTLLLAPGDLYLLKGQKIFEKNEEIPENCTEILERAGVPYLIEVEEDELQSFLFNTEYKPIDLENRDLFQEEGRLQRSLYNREGELVLSAGSVWTRGVVENLKRKNESVLYLRRSKSAIKKNQESAAELKRRLDSAKPSASAENKLVDDLSNNFKEVNRSYFNEDLIDELEERFKDTFEPDTDNSLIHKLADRDFSAQRSDQEKESIIQFHDQTFTDLKSVLYGIAMKSIVDSSDLSEISKKIIEVLVRDKEMLLNSACLSDEFDENFVISHTIKSTIVSVNIALSMGFSSQQIYELAIGALLHDIGMLHIPAEILSKSEPLNGAEKAEIFRHPSYALDILEKVRNLPVTTPLVAYHCHERGDRSGYPKGRSMLTINRYARIIAIADIYCAMISKRPYRKPFTPYSVVEYLIREAVSGRIDSKVFKAFLRINSLYPLGSWVALNDDRVGKVVAADPEHYDKPIVRIFFVNKKRIEDGETVYLANSSDIKVSKAFSGAKLNIAAMEGF